MPDGSEDELAASVFGEVDIAKVIAAYDSLGLHLSDDDYRIMAESLVQDWTDIIPLEMIGRAKAHRGMWIEPGKITVSLPSGIDLQSVASQLASLLPGYYCTTSGRVPIVDVCKADSTGKLTAANLIMQRIGVVTANVVAFGDSPSGN